MGDLSWRFDEREYNYIKEVLDSGFASGTSGNMNTRLERAFAEKFWAKNLQLRLIPAQQRCILLYGHWTLVMAMR